jgi:hypothetical protein
MVDDSDEYTRLQKMLEAAYKPPEPIPYSPPPFSSASPEHYAQSLTPRQVLERFPFDHQLSVIQLKRELEVDRVQGIAHQAIWSLGEDEGTLANFIAASWVWWLAMPRPESDFWDTGYLDIWVPSTIHSYRVELMGRIRLYGVRFWPDGDAFKVLSTDTEEEAKSQELKPPVAAADIERWYSVFSGTHEISSEDFAVRSAQAMFPDNHVSRQRVRDLRGPQKRGKPSNRDK